MGEVLQENRRDLFEVEIDKCKVNIELIFDEYSRIIESYPGQFLSTVGELKDVLNTLRQLGKTYINADNLLMTKDDWAKDVIMEVKHHNQVLKEWIHRRENPDFDMDNCMTILEARILAVYQTTQRLVDASKDAQRAIASIDEKVISLMEKVTGLKAE